MPRIRTIQPHFPRSPSMGRIGREARLLFIQLWTLADDAGRLAADPSELLEQLYPYDPDAKSYLASWIAELERVKCVERYIVDDRPYLRIVNWRKYQAVDRPTPSRLPAAPREPREAREDGPESHTGRASKAIPREPDDFDTAVQDSPREISRQRVLEDLDLALRRAIKGRADATAARYIDLMGRHLGLWHGKPPPPQETGPAPSPRDDAP